MNCETKTGLVLPISNENILIIDRRNKTKKIRSPFQYDYISRSDFYNLTVYFI